MYVGDTAALLVVPVLGATLFVILPRLERWLDRDEPFDRQRRPT
jgi:hypothetical protein